MHVLKTNVYIIKKDIYFSKKKDMYYNVMYV